MLFEVLLHIKKRYFGVFGGELVVELRTPHYKLGIEGNKAK